MLFIYLFIYLFMNDFLESIGGHPPGGIAHDISHITPGWGDAPAAPPNLGQVEMLGGGHGG
jgi:hypothetical protein